MMPMMPPLGMPHMMHPLGMPPGLMGMPPGPGGFGLPLPGDGSGEVTQEDAELMQEVNKRLEAKEMMVARLRELNSEAEAGVHLDEMGRHSEAFQMQYSQVGTAVTRAELWAYNYSITCVVVS